MPLIYRSGLIVDAAKGRVTKKVVRGSQPIIAYGINPQAKRKILDAVTIQAMDLSNSWQEGLNRKVNHVFFTVTFEESNIDSWYGNSANVALSKWLENCKKNYKMSSYVWVREYTKELVPHYHVIATMPFISISKLNKAWSRARGDKQVVKNALRTGYDPVTKKSRMKLQSYEGAVNYALKYIQKSSIGDICVMKPTCLVADRKTWEFKNGHSVRAYGISHNLYAKPRRINWDLARHMYKRIEYNRLDTDFARLYFIEDIGDAKFLYNLALQDGYNDDLSVNKVIPTKNIKPKQKVHQKSLF